MKRSRRKNRSSRKLKSKKLRYRHDSPSCSDTDFESSTSLSSSSSEDDEKVGRSRSNKLKNAKPGKKRAKKRSRDDQIRDLSPHPRKRKHSKRHDRCEVKKTNKRKKRRRDVSVSATSRDSLSCSTCGDGSTTSNESEIDRHRGRSGKRKRNRGKTERSRYRSKSHSPCSLCSEGSDYQNEVEDGSYVENNFRRLRSVIVVVGEENKLKTFDGNEQQEEVMHHPDDDHPSFGDMDSNDGMSKRELDRVTSNEASEVENKKEVVIPDIRNFLVVKDGGVQNEGSNNNHGGVTNDHPLNEGNNGSGNTDRINCIDLESILRQRALENLRKFKGVPPKNVETSANCQVDNSNDAKQLYSPVSNSVRIKSPRDDAEINGKGFSGQGGGNAVNPMIVEENGVESTNAIDSAVASTHDPIYSSQNLGKISSTSNGMNELKQDISSLDQEAVNDNICQKVDADICSTTSRSNLVYAALRPDSKVDFLVKQASAPQEYIQTKPSVSDMGVDEIAQMQIQTRNNDDQNIVNGFDSSAHKPSSSLNYFSGENSLNKPRHESGEGSQFEQKTMSVMRGGEMVQVRILTKIYIFNSKYNDTSLSRTS